MKTTIKFLGTAAFEINTSDGKRILIDPYLDENEFSPIKTESLDQIDLLLVTHAAYDHIGDTLKIMQKLPDLTLICGADVRAYLMHEGINGDRLISLPWGMMTEVNGIKVRSIQSMHWSFIQAKDGSAFSCMPLGFLIYTQDDHRIYHSGDTCVFSDMKIIGELYKPTVGLLNVGVPEVHQGTKHGVNLYLAGEMDAEEAVMAAKFLDLKYAIPCHFDNPSQREIQKFKILLEKERESNPNAPEPIILGPGGEMSL